MVDQNVTIVENLVILPENATATATATTTTTIKELINASVVENKDISPKIVLKEIERTIWNATNVMKLDILLMSAQVNIMKFSMILWGNILKNIYLLY